VNDDPTVANLIPDQLAIQDIAFNFQFADNTFADEDGDILTYTATLTSGGSLPSWLTFDANSRTFSGTPADIDIGSISVRVTATDANSSSTFDDFVITVDDTNDAPTDITLDNTNVDENDDGAVIGNLGVVDPDTADTHTWSVSDTRFEIVGTQLRLKTGLSLDKESEPIVNLTITATDMSGSNYVEAFVITVENVNEAPIADVDNYSVTAGNSLIITASGVLLGDDDPDGDMLTAVLLVGPSRGTLTLNADGSFTYTPVAGFNGTDFFVYQASDGLTSSASTLVTIVVNPALVIAPPPIESVNVDDAEVAPPSPPVEEPQQEPPPPPEDTTAAKPSAPSVAAATSPPPAGVSPVQPVAEPKSTTKTLAVSTDVSEGVDTDDGNVKQKPNRQSEDRDKSRLRSELGSIYRISANDQQWQDLDSFRDDLLGDFGFQTLVVGAAVSTSLSLSVGYVFWSVRAGWLASALMTSMPVWRSIDPLPVLEYLDDDLDSADDDSLQSIIHQQTLEQT
jgi:hypothetical protein